MSCGEFSDLMDNMGSRKPLIIFAFTLSSVITNSSNIFITLPQVILDDKGDLRNSSITLPLQESSVINV